MESDPRAPDRIGPYHVLERIGEGGMGTVYAAIQEEPVRRKVALKVIKPGMDSAQVVARFEAERQALALMNHENIAQVYDGGVDESGRPYFAMEYVPGVPITEFCDRAKLATVQRIELFLDVCDAVQHAHQKGIIHRDIKPTNVLVTVRDELAVPKVIDFGVARATNEPLTEHTLHTMIDQMIGTLDYMSPEQADPSALDVDTRSDVYSLGVLLYELLTGVMPFDTKELHRLALSEIRETITQKDPPTPSTRVRGLAETSTAIATKRGTDEGSLVRQLRGDLDWITMKAMEKDRIRRYASASDLAADLRRHLADEPVLAGPPSAGYRVRKFVRRNRTLVAAGAIVFIALVGGVVGTTWGMLEASDQARIAVAAQGEAEEAQETADREREEAELARAAEGKLREEAEAARAAETRLREEAELAKKAEEELRKEAERARGAERDSRVAAEREAQNASAATAFLIEILELANPEVSLRSELTMREVLDRAALRVERSLAGQPEAERTVRSTLGRAYLSIGEVERADAHLQHALELLDTRGDARPEELYQALWPLMRVMIAKADFSLDSLSLARRWLAVVPQMFGDEHAELRALFPPPTMGDRPDVAEMARLARAELRPGDPRRLVVADFMWAYGWYVSAIGQRDESTQQALEESLRIRRSELPESHPDIAATLNVLVDVLNQAGRYDRAEELIREALRIRREVLPEDDAGIAATNSLLGECLAGQGRRAEAEELLVTSRDVLVAARRPGHPEIVAAESRLVRAYENWQEPENARPHRRALAAAICASDTPDREWPPIPTAFGPENAALFDLLGRLRERVEERAEPADVGEAWRAVAAERERSLAGDDPLALLASLYLVDWGGRLVQGRVENLAVAEEILREALAIQAEHPGQLSIARFEALWYLASVCEVQDRFDEGEGLARECLAAAMDLDDLGGWPTASAETVLAGCLIGQGRYAEAEPLALRSALAMVELKGLLNDTVVAGCERVHALYTAWGDARNAEAMWLEILRRTVDRGLSGGFIDRTCRWVVTTPGLDAAIFDLVRDFARRRISILAGPEDRRPYWTLLVQARLRGGGYEEVRALLEEIETETDGANAVEWAVYSWALSELGEGDEASEALSLAKEIHSEGGQDAVAERWIVDAEAALGR